MVEPDWWLRSMAERHLLCPLCRLYVGLLRCPGWCFFFHFHGKSWVLRKMKKFFHYGLRYALFVFESLYLFWFCSELIYTTQLTPPHNIKSQQGLNFNHWPDFDDPALMFLHQGHCFATPMNQFSLENIDFSCEIWTIIFCSLRCEFSEELGRMCAYGCLFPSQILSKESIIITCLFSGATGTNSKEGTWVWVDNAEGFPFDEFCCQWM